MTDRRWTRIIPVALVMYTIAYMDRTNVSMAFAYMDGELKAMGDALEGLAKGIFFIGYLLLQIPGGWLAQRWSAKRFISILLVLWGVCAVLNGLVRTPTEFLVVRFLLGVAESGVFPATLVLLSNWFARSERARANAYWCLCQPLAVVATGPLSGLIIEWSNWRWMMVIEGALPFLWLGIWALLIEDRPSEARWLSREERESIEEKLREDPASAGPPPAAKEPFLRALARPQVLLLIAVYFLLNCGSYGLMFEAPKYLKGILPEGLRGDSSSTLVGILFAVPYVVTAFAMVLIARSSDRTRERRGHVAFALATSGIFLLASVLASGHSFWLAFLFLSLATPGPFATLGPFWAIPAETLPPAVVGAILGLVNALGNLGGFVGPSFVGYVKEKTGGVGAAFGLLAGCLIAAAAIALFLRKAPPSGGDEGPSKGESRK